jgi:hypothetical protein
MQESIQQATPGVNAAFDLIGLTQLRNDPQFQGIDGSGFSIAVLDTGLDSTHPLISSHYLTGVDFVYGQNSPFDREGHGTHVAGIIGATDENIGVATDVRLIGLKVLDDDGRGTGTDIEQALQWVIDNREKYNIIAVNMSLGGGFYRSAAEANGDLRIDEVKRLEAAGVTVVSAGGNSFKNNEYPNFAAPGIYSTLVVGAVWKDGLNTNVRWGSGAIDITTGQDRLTSFSQRLDGSNTIFAPGALITSTIPGGSLDAKAGTSQASPIVAGAVALMQEAAMQFGGRLLTPAEIVEIVRSTGDSINDGDDENDNVQNTNLNFPRLNIYKAIVEIKKRFNNIAPPPNNGNAPDANGTFVGAIIGPQLDGSAVVTLVGSIGIDGTASNIGDKDVDIYKFELLSPGSVTLEVTSDPNNTKNFDSYLRLFDLAGNQLSAVDDSGSGEFSKLTYSLDKGSYYVGISGDNNRSYNGNQSASGVSGATGNYSLQFSLSNGDPNGLISGAVPVNLGNDLQPLSFQGFIGADLGKPVGTNDVDLYKIVIPDDGTLLIDIDTPFDTDYVDSYLRLFNAQGEQDIYTNTGEPVVSDDDLAYGFNLIYNEFEDEISDIVYDENSNAVGHNTDSFIGATVKRGEVYYIGVSDFDNQNYDSTNLNNRPTSGSGGSYNLTVSFANNDPNGTIKNARSFTLPFTNQRGIIGQDSIVGSNELRTVGDRDVDFFKINSPSAGILEINVDSYLYQGNANFTPVDTVALIFNANGTLLASNDDPKENEFDALLQVSIEANRDYYIAITGYGNENFDPNSSGSGAGGETGDYFLSMQVLPPSQSSSLTNDRVGNGTVETIGIAQKILAHLGEDNGFFVGDKDIDLYKFIPTTTTRVKISTSTLESFSADTFLRFFDANGQEIAKNDNIDSNTRSSSLTVNAISNTTYYIGVNGSSNQASNYNPLTGEGAASGSTGSYQLEINNAPSALNVTNFQATNSGFVVTLNGDLDTNKLNLYSGQNNPNQSADVTLVNKTNNTNIKGSIVWDNNTRSLTFVKTGGILAAGTYEATLVSGKEAIVTAVGETLDGNGDGISGDNYIGQFTITDSSNAPILTLPDFSRDRGQSVDLVINNEQKGLAIDILNPSNTRNIDFQLSYNPNLLDITGISLANNVSKSWQINSSNINNGIVSVNLSGTDPLTGGNLLVLNASVPNTATIGGSEILKFNSLTFRDGNNGVLTEGRGDFGIHQVTSLGDVNGNGRLTGLDSSFIGRVVSGIDSGFSSFANTDPLIVADVDRNNIITANDITLVSRLVVGF